jgi:hypothetical protein
MNGIDELLEKRFPSLLRCIATVRGCCLQLMGKGAVLAVPMLSLEEDANDEKGACPLRFLLNPRPAKVLVVVVAAVPCNVDSGQTIMEDAKS